MYFPANLLASTEKTQTKRIPQTQKAYAITKNIQHNTTRLNKNHKK